jgi:hypothetical protein
MTTMTQRDVYVEKMKQQLDAMNTEMTALEVRAQQIRTDAGERVEQEFVRLQAHASGARAKLDEVRLASEASWQQGVAEMEKLRQAFTDSVQFFKAKMRSDPL